jgi:signal transduction histidine kinase
VREGEQEAGATSTICEVRGFARRLEPAAELGSGGQVPFERRLRPGFEHSPRVLTVLKEGEHQGRRPGAARMTPHEYARRLLAAQDEERRRIARELHDGTASTLVALSLELTRLVAGLAAGESRDLAAGCAALCEQSLRELRAAAFVLHPPVLARAGLAVALQWLTEGFSKRSGIHVSFDPGEPMGERPNSWVELTLYRIAQEALTNVLRHSGSRTARVVLDATEAEVRLTVSDRGRARPGRGRGGGGVGIASMRARVRALGGWLKLTFRETGTVLSAAVPRG